jgi:hypothetical protein
MTKVRCTTCGEESDLLAMEPSYSRPDAYFEIPKDQREFLANFSSDDGRIRNAEDTERRHFLRVLLSIPIRGEARDVAWGVWVEVSPADWERAYDLWDDPKQGKEPPFPAKLANTLRCYEGTVGLPGQVQLTSPKAAPVFTLDPDADHPLARDQREGVQIDRVIEWVSAHHH